jgi:hypothetical protein
MWSRLEQGAMPEAGGQLAQDQMRGLLAQKAARHLMEMRLEQKSSREAGLARETEAGQEQH